jgi:acetoin utilization deacetylase AcuC-like enzyme
MSLAMPVVWSDSCRLHDPGGEIWVGVRTEGTEVAARVDAVRDSLVGNGASIVEAVSPPDESLLRVHDDSLLSYLASAWEEWTTAGLPEDPGQDRVVPYVFAHASLTSGRAPHIPAATWAKPGYFAYDTMTLVGPGTWEAARAPSTSH